MPTVDRVLPWRRTTAPPAIEVEPLVSAYRSRHPKASVELFARAYERARDAHAGQIRKSGEPYIQHPLAVARIVADLGLDDTTIAAALLHDAVEDTGISLDDLEAEFGADVAAIVDGVTKLDRVRFDSKEAQQAATMRKMLVAMAKDLRVLIIKLADRLHNMRTLAALPEWKQERIARETLDIYAPLAHRLGMQEVKQQLEDLAFATLHPKRYAEIDQMVAQRAPERDLYLFQVLEQVQERLAGAAHRRRRERPPEAPLEHLREDGREGARLRRHLRPGGHPGARRLGEGLLRGAGLDPRHVEAGAGPLQGLHRDAQVQPLPVAAHHRDRAAGQAPRGADPHPRDAPPRRERGRRALGLQGRRGRRQRPGLAEPHRRLGVRDLRPRRVHGQPQGRRSTRTRSTSSRPRAGSSPSPRAPHPSTSPTPSTPRSGTRASAPG